MESCRREIALLKKLGMLNASGGAKSSEEIDFLVMSLLKEKKKALGRGTIDSANSLKQLPNPASKVTQLERKIVDLESALVN